MWIRIREFFKNLFKEFVNKKIKNEDKTNAPNP